MGYTHYWYKNYDAEKDVFEAKYAELLPVAEKIVAIAGVELEGDVSSEYIQLNGVDEDGHQAFVWLPGKSVGGFNMLLNLGEDEDEQGDNAPNFSRGLFACCKTARKDYDIVVVAILCAIQQIYGDDLVKISSDGDMVSEWADGRELYEDAASELEGTTA
eukprot:gene16591-18922_t